MSNSGKRLIIGGVVVLLGLLIALVFRKSDQSPVLSDPLNNPVFKAAPSGALVSNQQPDSIVSKPFIPLAQPDKKLPDDPFLQHAVKNQKLSEVADQKKLAVNDIATEIPNMPREQRVLDGWGVVKPAQQEIAQQLDNSNFTQSNADNTARIAANEKLIEASLRPLDAKLYSEIKTTSASSYSLAQNPLGLSIAQPQPDKPRVDPLAPKVTANSDSTSMAVPSLMAMNNTSQLPVAASSMPATNGVMQHTIRDGDTLPLLAQHYLGNAARGNELFLANQQLLKNPDLLPIGTVLQIPNAVTTEPYIVRAANEPPSLALPQNMALNRPPTMDQFQLQNINNPLNRASPNGAQIDYQPAPANVPAASALPGWPPADPSVNAATGRPLPGWPPSNLNNVGTNTTPNNSWGSNLWKQTNSAMNRVSGAVFGTSSTLPETTNKTYVVEANDSWEKLAKKFYGDEKQANRLLQANTDRLSGMVALRPGMVLIVPPK